MAPQVQAWHIRVMNFHMPRKLVVEYRRLRASAALPLSIRAPFLHRTTYKTTISTQLFIVLHLLAKTTAAMA